METFFNLLAFVFMAFAALGAVIIVCFVVYLLATMIGAAVIAVATAI